ncbi:MAG TPA: citrate/2-methylcitrate synthase [Syntrophobacteria bacterium]|nr:citrate/2-methylcitrate synthase [Syntrophobacteria bacterium]
MEVCETPKNIGLRGVTIADTRVGDVDGKAGRLVYRGYLITDLAGKVSYEEVAHLLLEEKLPDREELASFAAALVAERGLPPEVINGMRTFPRTAVPMDVLQAAVAMLAHHDPDLSDTFREANLRKAIRLVAKLPTVVAAWHRIRNGNDPVEPDPKLGHSADFLYMLHGRHPGDEVASCFDTAMVLHAEHGFNASTFAAREVASTRAHMYAAVAAAIGSLSGDLHGGANARVMQMLLHIGTPERVESYVKEKLDAGDKIMGLGHAVYHVDDPRAHILAPMSRRVGERSGETKWYEISRLLEKTAKEEFRKRKGWDIPVNVDFYSASLYYAMHIPIDLFSPIFAMGRVAGWTAHVIEEQFAEAAPKPMLYRPESEYVGHYCGPEVCSFVPIDER